ncbi:cysteine peptidase family C39 domain-containing protein [Pleomorphomonas sp. NRK KF1]|uniref:cysteine peptidase family C39 domain-containing protein n=1 Tax=Pleomorphomonas sp. NRK KF1 TaxID=2943000 RepID=UPI0020436E27|nr:cysteine peptidase family C39 domain-containing protein [Pleomorphomonas sp. NRK KF1]MCM5552912.1 cysteine peptidase family C39 domain-containing protein [Pleomorphomonas sp. NRK KF1]
MGFSVRSSPRRRAETPDIRQGEHAECGLAALGILLGYHGVHTSLAELRRRAGSTLLGSTLRQLCQIAESEGFAASARRTEPSDLEKLGLPLIAHMRFIHFAVVEKISEDAVHLNDPSSGPIVLTREEFSRDFTGIVLRLIPRNTRPRGRPFSLLQALIAAFRPQIPLFLSACILAVISGILASFSLWALSGKGEAPASVGLLLLAVVVQGGALLLAALLAHDAANAARRRIMAGLAGAPDRYYLEARPDRTLGFLTALRGLQQNSAPFSTVAFFWTASTLGLAAVVAPILVLPVATLSLIQGGIVLRSAGHRSSHAARFGRDAMPVRAMDESYLAESARYRIGRGAESHFSWLAGIHATDASYALKAAEQHDAADTWVAMLDLCKIVLPISLSARGFGDSGALPFALLVAAASSMMLHFIARNLSIRPVKDALLRLSDPPPEPPKRKAAPPSAPSDARLIMESVEWAPTGMTRPVISGLSLRLRAGETTVAHGAPGSGATSFARLAAGMIEPTSGRVRLRGSAVLIDHQRFLVPGALRHNLSLGDPDIDEQTMRSALETVRLNAVFGHRGGLDFILKGDSPRISGGQIRRLMIARALCRTPDVLILDGALDNVETELAGSILADLGKQGLAVVVTTKNLDLLRFADQSIELGAGGE